ncbi:MAG TPA: EthD domain-containing protein [Solirubrobacterales bacterium]|nr:EthD domain-containing protein [Solirubrobacterales bacterium]
MHKIIGFCERPPYLTHDQYREGHAGFHVSIARRLPKIRGYVNCVWAPGSDEKNLFASDNPPDGFIKMWDGYSELWFDNEQDYYDSNAGEVEDRVGPDGMQSEALNPVLAEDSEWLYIGIPYQFGLEETEIVPVVRPERFITKIIQWGAKADGLSDEEFRKIWAEEYAPLYSKCDDLFGYTLNFTIPDESSDVREKFFKSEVWGETEAPAEVVRREKFMDPWDGMAHIWVENAAALEQFRSDAASELKPLEDKLFSRLWHNEVNETVGVIPRREAWPDVYVR